MQKDIINASFPLCATILSITSTTQFENWRRLSYFTGLFQPLIKSDSLQVGRGEAPQSPICNLNLSLPDNIQPEPAPSEPDLLALEKKYAFLSISE